MNRYVSLPSWKDYIEAKEKLMGTTFISKIWCKYIRPFLQPTRHWYLSSYYRWLSRLLMIEAIDDYKKSILNRIVLKEQI